MLCLEHALYMPCEILLPLCSSILQFKVRVSVLIGATEAIPCFPILVYGNKLWISCRGDNERSAIVEELFSSFLSNRENNIQFFHLDYISAIPHTLSTTQIRDDVRSCVLFVMITQHFVVVVIACEMELWRRGLEDEERLSRVGGAIKDISRRREGAALNAITSVEMNARKSSEHTHFEAYCERLIFRSFEIWIIWIWTRTIYRR